MDKFVQWIKNNKAKIVAVLTAVLTFVISISEIDLGTKMGIVCSILIVIIPVIISFIEGKDMNATITLLVNAIEVIQEIVKQTQPQVSSERVHLATALDIINTDVPKDTTLTKEEIKERLVQGL